MNLKPLGIVKTIVEAAGMGISYAYDDLVFLDHNAFLLQFTDNDQEILIHANREAEGGEINDSVAKLKNAAVAQGMTFMDGGLYTLTQLDDENIRIEFL
jgi:hypothetical protein